MSNLKSNWGSLSAHNHIQSVPRRGVGNYVSRAEQERAKALGLSERLKEIKQEGSKQRKHSNY